MKRAPLIPSRLQAAMFLKRLVLRRDDRAIDRAGLFPSALIHGIHKRKREAFDVRLVYLLISELLKFAFLVLYRIGIIHILREGYRHTSQRMVSRYIYFITLDNKLKLGP